MVLMSRCLDCDGVSHQRPGSSSPSNTWLICILLCVSRKVVALSGSVYSPHLEHPSLIRRKQEPKVNNLKIQHELPSIVPFSRNSRVQLNSESLLGSSLWPTPQLWIWTVGSSIRYLGEYLSDNEYIIRKEWISPVSSHSFCKP